MRKRDKKIKEKRNKKESKNKEELDCLDMILYLYVLGFNRRFH